MTLFLKVQLRPTGIIALRALPQSKMRTALRYVPPTTLIGAIAYPLLHISGDRGETIYEKKIFKSKAESVIGLFKWVTIKTEGRPKLYGSLLKINTIYRGKVQSAVTSFPFAVFYGESTNSLTAAYFVDEDALSESTYSSKDLERAAWGITRLGSRESIVSVEDVKMGKAVFREANKVRTAYAFPFKGVNVHGKGTLQAVVDWRLGIGDYSNAKRMVMFYPEETVEVQGRLSIAELDGEVVILAP
ncbi:MAG: CRISPR-associated protein Cas5a/b/c [Thermococcaceae archaeon]|nr:CRISPR-associated protein Cas5a/b/c [Thermococcaceae archaeon]MDK2915063.1 CRISPR-associated protein Cas5a/b/c [Thermococcaceae archaeon]